MKVLEHERALVFRDGALEEVLQPGVHWRLDPLFQLKVEVVSIRNGWLIHPDVELLVRSGRLGHEVRVVDLKTHQRAIVWADGRRELVLPGTAAQDHLGRRARSAPLSAAWPSTLQCLGHHVDQLLILENLVDPTQDRVP